MMNGRPDVAALTTGGGATPGKVRDPILLVDVRPGSAVERPRFARRLGIRESGNPAAAAPWVQVFSSAVAVIFECG